MIPTMTFLFQKLEFTLYGPFYIWLQCARQSWLIVPSTAGKPSIGHYIKSAQSGGAARSSSHDYRVCHLQPGRFLSIR